MLPFLIIMVAVLPTALSGPCVCGTPTRDGMCSQFECNDGACISSSKLCDSHDDCSEGEDEDYCAYMRKPYSHCSNFDRTNRDSHGTKRDSRGNYVGVTSAFSDAYCQAKCNAHPGCNAVEVNENYFECHYLPHCDIKNSTLATQYVFIKGKMKYEKMPNHVVGTIINTCIGAAKIVIWTEDECKIAGQSLGLEYEGSFTSRDGPTGCKYELPKRYAGFDGEMFTTNINFVSNKKFFFNLNPVLKAQSSQGFNRKHQELAPIITSHHNNTSDEICRTGECGAGEFACLNGYQCVKQETKCDLHSDCDDTSDELDCPCTDSSNCISNIGIEKQFCSLSNGTSGGCKFCVAFTYGVFENTCSEKYDTGESVSASTLQECKRTCGGPDLCIVATSDAVDCGYEGITLEACQAKSCCYKQINQSGTDWEGPWCYFQKDRTSAYKNSW